MENSKQSAIDEAHRKGLNDGLNKRSAHWPGDWTEEARQYYATYKAGRGQLLLTEQEIDSIIKSCCACLTWERRDQAQGMTDKELYDYLAKTLPEGGSTGPGEIAKETKPAGLRIYATWECVVAGKPEYLICAGMETVRRARMLYNIEDPTEKQISLF